MKLRKIKIKDYKSIIECEIPIKSDLLCFVGKNESGKSNVLKAFKYLDFRNQFDPKDINKTSSSQENVFPAIYMQLEITQDETNAILDYLRNLEFIDKELLNHGTAKFRNVDFLRWGNDLNAFQIVIYNKSRKIDLFELIKDKTKLGFFLQEFYNNFFPHVEYFENEELSLEAASVNELKGKSKKFDTFRKLLYISGCQDFNLLDINIQDRESIANRLATYQRNATKIFTNYYFQDQSIQLNIIYVGDKISLSINDDTGAYFSIAERSPGFRYFFAFLVNKISITQQRNRSSIFLLDEPANNLHPKGARDFINLISKIDNSQIIFNTHNPFLISREDLDSLILLKKDNVKGTIPDLKPYRNNYQVLRRELGMLLNDSFLVGETNITVEGGTEKFCLSLIFNDLCKNPDIPMALEWVNIFNCGGVTETKVSLNYLGKTLNLNGIVLLDSDKEADDMLKHKKNKLIHDLVDSKKWSIIRLNDIYSDKNIMRTFEDLFPQELYIKKFNEYCNDLGLFDRKFDNFLTSESVTPPIIDTLKVHFLSFFDEKNKKGKTINKIHVARLIFDSLPQREWRNRLPNLYKLANKINSELKK